MCALLFWDLKSKWEDQTKLVRNKLTTDVSLNSKWLYSGFAGNKHRDPSNCLKEIGMDCKKSMWLALRPGEPSPPLSWKGPAPSHGVPALSLHLAPAPLSNEFSFSSVPTQLTHSFHLF